MEIERHINNKPHIDIDIVSLTRRKAHEKYNLPWWKAITWRNGIRSLAVLIVNGKNKGIFVGEPGISEGELTLQARKKFKVRAY